MRKPFHELTDPRQIRHMAICYARKHGAAKLAEDFAQYVFLRRAIKPGYVGRLQNFLFDFLRQELGDLRRDKHQARKELGRVSIDEEMEIADHRQADVAAMENKIIHPLRDPNPKMQTAPAPQTPAEILKSLEESLKKRGIVIGYKRDDYVIPKLMQKPVPQEKSLLFEEKTFAPRPFGRAGLVELKRK